VADMRCTVMLPVCTKCDHGRRTSVVVFADVAVVVMAVPHVNAICFGLVVVKRPETLVPSAPYSRLLRLVAVPAALRT